MSFRIVQCEQRTPEWFQARCGRLTGTSADAMLSLPRSKGKKESDGRRDLRLRLAAERLTSISQEDGVFPTDAIKRGIEKEPDAVRAYEAATGQIVQKVGFLAHDSLMAGCSLDGYVGAGCVGILEIKAPKTATHLEYMSTSVIPLDYMRQITHNLWISGAEWCDFVSFDDRLPSSGQLVRLRVRRGDVDIKAYELAARLFLGEVDAEVARIESLMADQEAL